MKINFDKQKSTEAITGLVSSTVDLGKKAAINAKTGVLNIMEKSKNDSITRKLKKYNPVFPQHYLSPDFNLPNLIVIVDDAVRRGIDVCEGAIGWLSKDTGVEILYLYDEAISFSGIQFVPSAVCDAIYYIDNFDRNRFIRVDCVFSKAHEERMAELKHIAHSLGARRCSIRISEVASDSNQQNKEFNLTEKVRGIDTSESASQTISTNKIHQRSGHIEVEFEGSNSPIQPVLKWFAHDDSIKRLIEMRCTKNNTIKSETLELSGSSYSTMSQKTAHAIDSSIDKIGGLKGKISMNSQAEKEYCSKLLFHVEF